MPHAEMAPVVVDWVNELTSASPCVREMRGDELHLEDRKGEKEHFVKKRELRFFIVVIYDAQDGGVGDLEDWKKSAVLQDRCRGRLWIVGRRHVDEGLHEIEGGSSVLVPTIQPLVGGDVVLCDCLYKEVESFMASAFTVSQWPD